MSVSNLSLHLYGNLKTINVMNTKLNVPKVENVDLLFSTLNTNKELLALAQEKESELQPYASIFSTLFYSGGVLHFKEGIDPEYRESLTRYLKAFMRSWNPKHEHKEAVSSLILSELVDASKY